MRAKQKIKAQTPSDLFQWGEGGKIAKATRHTKKENLIPFSGISGDEWKI
jgi:hypothetical protein